MVPHGREIVDPSHETWRSISSELPMMTIEGKTRGADTGEIVDAILVRGFGDGQTQQGTVPSCRSLDVSDRYEDLSDAVDQWRGGRHVEQARRRLVRASRPARYQPPAVLAQPARLTCVAVLFMSFQTPSMRSKA